MPSTVRDHHRSRRVVVQHLILAIKPAAIRVDQGDLGVVVLAAQDDAKEQALEQFKHKDEVDVVWRSFELDPNLKTDPDKNLYEYFAEMKGMPIEKAREMNQHVAQAAKEVGLDFNLEDVIIANSLKAHRLIHMADSKGLGTNAKEALFKAHFTEGKNIDDLTTLAEIGATLGFEVEEVIKTLSSEAFTDEVRRDEAEAGALGIRGVPFFVIDNKYGVSGAQSPETFLQALNKSWEEQNPA